MDFRLLLNTIKHLISDPAKAWETVYSGNKPFNDNNVLYPMLILGSVSAFLGSFLFAHNELKSIYFVLAGIRYFLLMIITVYVTTLVFIEIAKAFNFKYDFSISFKLVVYSLVPLFLCQILSRLFESFIFVNILSLYGLYIFWTGIEIVSDPRDNKKLHLLISAALAFIATFLVTNWLLTRIIDRIYFAVFA